MLKIKILKICQKEQRYVLDILLGEFLGLKFDVEIHDENFIEIDNNDSSIKFTLDSSFFLNAHKAWLGPSSMPKLPLKKWIVKNENINVELIEPSLPLLYGKFDTNNPKVLIKNNKNFHLNLDIFGSVFFMLSRYEEIVEKERDDHGRFKAESSIASKENFLYRPLVDEYLEILWDCLKKIWPDLNRNLFNSKTLISCDVDQIYVTVPRLIKSCLGDLIIRKNLLQMSKRISTYISNKLGLYQFDRSYTFDWYMDLCEKAGLKASFYFLPSSKEEKNGTYEITDKKVIALLKNIDQRGHEIGIHGCYQTFNDQNKIINQKFFMESVLKKIGINQRIKGNRQHYLRWDSSITPEYLDTAGFEYDTTGCYADKPGFRYGTSKEFSLWGWQSYKKLKLKERPLIMMESTIISENYMGMGYSKKTSEFMFKLKKASLKYGGNFTILWHNSHFENAEDKILFENLIF